MSFLYKVDVPTPDGTSVEPVELEFKDIKDLPVGILRKNRHDFEAVMWATFEWGLSPEQLELFDRLPVPLMMTILDAWQASETEKETESESESEDDGDGASDEESEAKTPPKKRTAR